MINPSEIRIGNWVIDDRISEGAKYIQLDFVSRQQSYIDVLKHIHAIPISPEILEKCGFKNSNNPFNQDAFEHSNPYHEIHYDAGYYTYSFDYKEIIDVQSLHQLQNLYFALTGQELEINLSDVPVAP